MEVQLERIEARLGFESEAMAMWKVMAGDLCGKSSEESLREPG